MPHLISLIFFFFNDTATTEIYTLSLHDALPISHSTAAVFTPAARPDTMSWRESPTKTVSVGFTPSSATAFRTGSGCRSEEHTSELQSLAYLVCRLLLEKKKNNSSEHKDKIYHTP